MEKRWMVFPRYGYLSKCNYFGLRGPISEYFSEPEEWGFMREDDAQAVADLLNKRMKARAMAARIAKRKGV